MTWGVTTNSEKPEDQKQVNNVSGTVPAMTTVVKPSSGQQINYASRSAYIAGIAKVIGGILCFIFGLLQCYSLWRLHILGRIACGYGEVCGLLFIATGSVAINASQRKTPKRIAASMGMSFISVMVSAGVWIWMIYFGATKAHFMKKGFYRRRWRHHGGSSGGSHGGSNNGSHGGSNNGSHGGSNSGSHERHERSIFNDGMQSGMLIPILWLVSTIFIFVLLTAMFSASVVQAVVCYRAYRSRNRYIAEDDDTTYIVPFKIKEKMLADPEDLPKVKV
jgi:hypothetical protein